MKKLVLIFTILGLMFQVAGCTGKKAQDDTEVVENADVEKIEAEEANFTGEDAVVDAGPVDESLQAALGETPQVDDVEAATPSSLTATTDAVNTEMAGLDISESLAPSLDETSVMATPTVETTSEIAANTPVDAGISETPVVDPGLEAPAPDLALSLDDPAFTDPTAVPDATVSGGAVTEMNGAAPEAAAPALVAETVGPETVVPETPVAETPVSTEPSFVAKESAVTAEASQDSAPRVAKNSSSAANSKGLRKIAETSPYQHGDGYVNTVYIARPKEKLKAISQNIYGMDKTKELKSINAFLKGRGPKAGEKIYYISPNRPTDASRTMSYYEDTGMIASTYVAQKGDNLKKVSKKLLGYDNAWQEVWTTNEVASKGKLTAGDSLRYWKPAEQTTRLADLGGSSKLVDSAEQLPVQAPPDQNVASNTLPPAQEMAPPVQTQDMPPPPPPPDFQTADMPPADQLNTANPAITQETPPQPPAGQELAPPPPPPPPQEVAGANPLPPKQNANPNMEEETIAEEGAMSSDTTMMLGVVVVLVAVLGMVLIRRNKKKREADMASMEHTHVGS